MTKSERREIYRAYTAVIALNTGSSWATGNTPEQAVKACIKRVKKDWGTLYDFPKGTRFGACVFPAQDWNLSVFGGFTNPETGDLIKYEVITIIQ